MTNKSKLEVDDFIEGELEYDDDGAYYGEITSDYGYCGLEKQIQNLIIN